MPTTGSVYSCEQTIQIEFSHSNTLTEFHRVVSNAEFTCPKTLQLVYQGISYLDEVDEAFIQQRLQENALLRSAERNISFRDDFNTCKDHVNRVTDWLDTACDESSLKIDTRTPFLQYLVHKELRNRFRNVWTLSGDNSVLSNRAVQAEACD